MSNHSPRTIQTPKVFWMVAVSLVMLFGNVQLLRAQMFSVEDEIRQFRQPNTELYLGFEPTSVTYEGRESAIDSVINNTGQFEYDAPVIRVGYSGRGLNLYMGVGGKVTGSDDVSYFDLGGNINYRLPLHVTPKFILLVPVRISSRYTNIANNRPEPAFERLFRFGSLIAGAGLKALAKPKPDIRIQLGVLPSYGFTFASEGIFGGGLGTLALNGRLFFDRLFDENIGLSAGYKYDFRTYNIDDDRFDYRMQGHSIQVGITF